MNVSPKYQKRFQIKHYPRTVKQSLRKKDESRKQKREAYKERKKLEKQARKDEVKEFRALKKKEIEEKLKKLKELAGDDDLSLNIDDLEADFDPTAYDKRMKVCSLSYRFFSFSGWSVAWLILDINPCSSIFFHLILNSYFVQKIPERCKILG